MDKTEKVEFLEYKLQLKKHDYDIFIPKKIPRETYLTPYCRDDYTFIDGNREMYKVLRAVCIILIRNPNSIVFIPARSKYNPKRLETVSEDGTLYPQYDIVFYCHNSQLNRNTFYELKNMIRFTKGIRKTIKYSIPSMVEYCNKQLKKFKDKQGYWINMPKWNFYDHETIFFIEGCRSLICDTFVDIIEYVSNTNFEQLLRENPCTPVAWGFGCEFGYWSTNIRKYQMKHHMIGR